MFRRKASPTPEDVPADEVEDQPAETQEAPGSSLKARVHSTLCFALAGGNVAFGLLASTQPSRLTGIMQEDESQVRRIGARDLAAGLALWGAKDKRWPLLLGIRANVFEAAGWARTKPKLALVPFAWAGLSVVALVTRPGKKPSK